MTQTQLEGHSAKLLTYIFKKCQGHERQRKVQKLFRLKETNKTTDCHE